MYNITAIKNFDDLSRASNNFIHTFITVIVLLPISTISLLLKNEKKRKNRCRLFKVNQMEK